VPRLVIVSNRVAVPGNEAPRQAGGLAVAVNAALKRREGIWFGWSGRVVEDGAAPQPTVVRQQRRTFITLDLSSVDFQEYYNGFANRVLWPILHYRVDLAEFTSVELTGYLRVNALFANALSPFIQTDDVIWSTTITCCRWPRNSARWGTIIRSASSSISPARRPTS
jgi:trehalose 6-phosphate synthase